MKILRRLLISLGLVTMIFVACKKDGNTSVSNSLDTTAKKEYVCKCTFTYSYADTIIKDTSISNNFAGTFLEAVNACDSIKNPVLGNYYGLRSKNCSVIALNEPIETTNPNANPSEKKEFICECISTDSSGFFEPYSNTETITGTKSEAIKICNSNSYTILTLTTICKLKE